MIEGERTEDGNVDQASGASNLDTTADPTTLADGEEPDAEKIDLAVKKVRGNMTKRVREWVPGTGEWYSGYTE